MRYNLYSNKKIGDHRYWTDQYQSRRYGYQRGERRQTERDDHSGYRGWTTLEPEYPGGYHYGRHQNLTITVPTEPTQTQAKHIARGETALPFTFSKEVGSHVGCNVIYRGEVGDQFAQIINRVELSVQPLSSLSILRVNKQALSECREVLYGQNAFVFNTGSERPFQSQRGIHEHDEVEHFPHWIPGMLQKNGAPQTTRQLDKAINRMFIRGGFLPKFVARDPMLQFFHRIGRVNASLLTRIKIEGCMKTVSNVTPEETWGDKPLGFARVLNILTVVLRNVCPNLRELELHMEDKVRDRDFKDTMLWDDDPYNNAGKSDKERIDEVVEKVITSLDSLKVLRLEAY